jgi:acyl-[acyl-carrier-protein]-phospholipid O-acyltransferase/long-chain-fatty-acid--[acyl-carrier-protein] ligase
MGTAKIPRADYNRLGFWSFIATQFQGAFSDNVHRWIVVFYAPLMLADEKSVTSLVLALFNLPWLLFPAYAGAIADKYSKKLVTVWTKVWEVGVMALAAVAVWYHLPTLLFITVFFMAMQSSFFSPAKYGIMPEMLPEERLSWGNGILNMFTFVAIILGTGTAGVLLKTFGDEVYQAMLVVVLFSLIGLVTSLFITPVKAAEPTRAMPLLPYSGLLGYFKAYLKDQRLFTTLVGISFFWFSGTLVLANITELAKTLSDDDLMRNLLLASMSLGIGIGSLGAGYLSRGKIEGGLVPLGLAGMAVVSLLVAIPGTSYWTTMLMLLFLGFFGGVFDVPLAAMLQQRSPKAVRGGLIATLNVFTFSSMMVATVIFFVTFDLLDLSPRAIFAVSVIPTGLMFLYLLFRTPMFLVRSVMWILDNTVLRLRVQNRENLPEHGGVLLVGSHDSFIDALVLFFSTGRDIHFVMGEDIYDTPWLGRLARFMHIIPVPKNATDEDMQAVLQAIRGCLREGHAVCVPQEQRFSPEGAEAPWHSDYALLTEGTDAPVAPAYVARLWGTLYNFDDEGKLHLMRPPRIPYSIMVDYGEACEVTTGPAVRDALQRLGTEAYFARPLIHPLLHRGFIKTARRCKRKLAIADAITGDLTYFKTLVGSIAFARKLQKILDQSEYVGLLLPPSVGGALTNIALQFMGRVPVNLNYSAANDSIASAAKQCGITQVLTSKKVLERLPIEVPGETIFLEDVRESVTGKDRIVALLFALLAPVWLIERACGSPRGRSTDDVATIIFSSGSEGAPKGIVLTQRNVLSNVEAVLETIPHAADERMMAFLPFFHSFGFTGTLWLMLHSGCGTVYHPTPLEPRAIGKLIEKYKCTVLIGTPTFLNGFLRRCDAEDLASMRFVVCGAEKMPLALRNGFLEKFGTPLMEGYGTTECAPVVSINIPDMVSPGFYVPGNRISSIGRPLPGISLRVTNPDTGEEVAHNTPGMLHVKGVNIMRGYLDQPEKTAAVLRDGWYETGDVAAIDDDGFIRITDRLARFSKVAGEMVPHTTIEERLLSLVDGEDQNLAVSSVPDEKRGERLVVLHTLDDPALERLIARMPETGLPNLWLPRANNFHRVDEIPVLGTGKLDIRGVREVAKEREGVQ